MRRICSSVSMLAFLLVTGCAPRIDVPQGYVTLRNSQSYELKAVSARGCVIALNTHPNEDARADLSFWSQAVEHQKVDLDGLRLAGRETIKSTTGLDGVLFKFELGEGQGKVAYLVALYVTPRQICTVEAGGPADLVAADSEKLHKAMLSVRAQ